MGRWISLFSGVWTYLSMLILTQSAYSVGFASHEPCQHDKSTFRCVKYTRNYDADTITVEIPGVHPILGEKIGIRVSGIDTPEMKGKLPCEKDAARAAQRLAENLLKNAKIINLKNVARDKYFRILADVEIDGRLLSEVLMKNHLAYEYHGGTKEKIDWCKFQKSNTRIAE